MNKQLCRNFAERCIKHEKRSDIFPLKEDNPETRKGGKCLVTMASTRILNKSVVPFMQRLLNEKKKISF